MRIASSVFALVIALAGTPTAAHAAQASTILDWIARYSFGLLKDEFKPPSGDVALHVSAPECGWRYRYETARGRADIDAETAPCATGLCRAGLGAKRAALWPIGRPVRVILSSAPDGARQLTLPALGLTLSAARGESAEAWLTVDRIGFYYGTGLCEGDPRPAPITVQVVSEEDWNAWLERSAAPRSEPR